LMGTDEELGTQVIHIGRLRVTGRADRCSA
jgi:hypothetical protein